MQREYLQLQNKFQQLQSKTVILQQENEAYKAVSTALAKQDQNVVKRLTQTQKKLNHLQQEYQALQQDYSDLKKSINPLVAQLQASVAAHRKELIGTELGTVILKSGRHLKQSQVTGITDQALRIKFSEGWVNVPRADLPRPIQQRFFFEMMLVPSAALLTESPVSKVAKPVSQEKKAPRSSPVEEAFAKRHRLELDRYQASIQPKIDSLKEKISSAKKQISKLRSDRTKASRYFTGRSGSIRRSPVDRDRALEKIDTDIRRLNIAITAAEAQINGWKKELQQAEPSKQ